MAACARPHRFEACAVGQLDGAIRAGRNIGELALGGGEPWSMNGGSDRRARCSARRCVRNACRFVEFPIRRMTCDRTTASARGILGDRLAPQVRRCQRARCEAQGRQLEDIGSIAMAAVRGAKRFGPIEPAGAQILLAVPGRGRSVGGRSPWPVGIRLKATLQCAWPRMSICSGMRWPVTPLKGRRRPARRAAPKTDDRPATASPSRCLRPRLVLRPLDPSIATSAVPRPRAAGAASQPRPAWHDLVAAEGSVRFLAESSGQNLRLVLIVTGKGTRLEGGRVFGGRIRAEFPGWLERADNRSVVAGVRAAHPRHGGSGAFYVLLRRRSSASSRSLRATPQR